MTAAPDDDCFSGPVPLEDVLDIVNASDVVLRRVRYLWERRIPLGASTLMPGEEGIGKSTVAALLIADITRGTLAGEFRGTSRDVIVMACEDGIEDVFVPRLKQAGADLRRVHIIRARYNEEGDTQAVVIPRDLNVIAWAVRKHRAALVFIDSLVTTFSDDAKTIAYKDVAKTLKAINVMAEDTRCAVLAPWHLNKQSGTDTAVRIMDSRAFRTAVRSMLLVVPDPDAEEGVTQGIVALDKANAGTLNVPALRYRIDSSTYWVNEVDEQTSESRDIIATCGVAKWIGEVEGGRDFARSALATGIDKPESPRAWLRDFLQQEGEVARSDVITAARDSGHSRSSIQRAATALRVTSREVAWQDEKTKAPRRQAMWSLSVGPNLHDTRTTEPTEPTGETYGEPIDPKGAGQRQSAQSAQSAQCHGSEPTGEPTGCEVCGLPLHALDIEGGFTSHAGCGA